MTPKMSKYRAKKTMIGDLKFDSKKEAARYGQLKMMERAGLIRDLELQPKFVIEVDGVKICSYRGDFRYWENSAQVVEDCKGFKTPEYKLKAKLMLAVHGIRIKET